MTIRQATLEGVSGEPSKRGLVNQPHEIAMPVLLTVQEAAELLRTTRRAIYAMVERHQLPGVVHIGRRVLVRADSLLDWVEQKSAPSQRSEPR